MASSTQDVFATTTIEPLNLTATNRSGENFDSMYPLELVIPFTIVYAVIFLTGVIGNISTCIVIAKNKSMHTATNYYLFSLAVSDMLLLISGLPPEMYRIWSPDTYIFGHVICFLQGFSAETSANATANYLTKDPGLRYKHLPDGNKPRLRENISLHNTPMLMGLRALKIKGSDVRLKDPTGQQKILKEQSAANVQLVANFPE